MSQPWNASDRVGKGSPSQRTGYRRWQQLGRQVRKGKRGIRILVPHKRVVELEEGEQTTIVRDSG